MSNSGLIWLGADSLATRIGLNFILFYDIIHDNIDVNIVDPT